MVFINVREQKKSLTKFSTLHFAKLKQKMKLLFLYSIFSFYFVFVSRGLKCYSCSDLFASSCKSNQTVQTCKENDFCIIATHRLGQHSKWECGNKDICVVKGCYDFLFCEKGHQRFDETDYVNGTIAVSCCQGDLCNFGFIAQETSAQVTYDKNKTYFILPISYFLFMQLYV